MIRRIRIMKKKRMRKQGQKQGKIEFEAKEWEKVR